MFNYIWGSGVPGCFQGFLKNTKTINCMLETADNIGKSIQITIFLSSAVFLNRRVVANFKQVVEDFWKKSKNDHFNRPIDKNVSNTNSNIFKNRVSKTNILKGVGEEE